MIKGIDAIQQQNIYRVNAVNLFEIGRNGVAERNNRFNRGLFAQQTNDNFTPNHPRVQGSETQARSLDFLA